MNRLPFQNKLYAHTKAKHKAVESIFNFKDGIQSHNINLFHKTMLAARKYCYSHLKSLEDNLNVQTFNDQLIQELKKDAFKDEGSVFLSPEPNLGHLSEPKNFNEQLGVFYVMAGSSAGAKILLTQVKKQNINAPFHYLTYLVNTSKLQMMLLNSLMTNQVYEQAKVLDSALAAFDLIYKIASYESKETTSQL